MGSLRHNSIRMTKILSPTPADSEANSNPKLTIEGWFKQDPALTMGLKLKTEYAEKQQRERYQIMNSLIPKL